jgi:hypothetical protein
VWSLYLIYVVKFTIVFISTPLENTDIKQLTLVAVDSLQGSNKRKQNSNVKIINMHTTLFHLLASASYNERIHFLLWDYSFAFIFASLSFNFSFSVFFSSTHLFPLSFNLAFHGSLDQFVNFYFWKITSSEPLQTTKPPVFVSDFRSSIEWLWGRIGPATDSVHGSTGWTGQ